MCNLDETSFRFPSQLDPDGVTYTMTLDTSELYSDDYCFACKRLDGNWVTSNGYALNVWGMGI